MSDLVRNPNCWFCHAQAHLSVIWIVVIIVVDGVDEWKGLPTSVTSKRWEMLNINIVFYYTG